jgi:tyrosyl-tRNA synthetase
MHIAQGLLRTINVNKMTKAGVKFKVLVADWFAWMNNKLGGDLEKIRLTGEYFIELWKACGMDLKNVEFIWSRDVVKSEKHWKLTIDIARNSTVKRLLRCSQIMGRKSGETLSGAQIIYPAMQAADIFELGADLCQLGMDQRKVNMLAREVAPKLGLKKPVVVSHHMLLGLGQPSSSAKDTADRMLDLKMSKSKPDSAIFMNDSDEDIKRKIKKAYCPEGIVHENPILEYCKYILFEKFDKLTIKRPEKFGGDLVIGSYNELEDMFKKKKLHPVDLKNVVSEKLIELLKPVREYFKKNKKAMELANKVKKFEITR